MENFHGECIALECSDHELAERIGKTVASVLSPKNRQNPLVIVGRDGGLSAGSIMIQCAGEYVQQELLQKNLVYCLRLLFRVLWKLIMLMQVL